MAGNEGSLIGWDVGGAHLKAARVRGGRVEAVVQEPCPLWQGLGELDRAFAAIEARIGRASVNPLTMTGELVDLFSSRREGVGALADLASERLAGCRIYAGASGFLPPSDADLETDAVASANWHATAALTGRLVGSALLVDMGSTTTDVVPVIDGLVRAAGRTDAERLALGELVYTGAVRTALMAVASKAPVGGRMQGVMAEYFATMADVNRLLGKLSTDADQHPSADGRGKSLAESRLRLSRMVGRDVDELDEDAWQATAVWFAEAQLRRVHDAALQVLSGATLRPDVPVMGCGIGLPTVRELARRLDRPFRSFSEILPLTEGADPALADWAAGCAPAVSVALLWEF